MTGIPFAKGHGTENDFVVLPDPDGTLDLTAARVAALCDRRRGLGADGVLRVVRWAALKDGDVHDFPAEPGVEWFMDYRNADGSAAEMCGNGVRVYAHWLDRAGWLPDGETAAAGHPGRRARGVVHRRRGGRRHGPGPRRAGVDRRGGGTRTFAGTAVDVGNPHLACVTDVALDALDLTVAPGYDRALFPHGVNVEFVTPVRDGRVAMRVHERGVGETRSCGTGTVAAVVAALRAAGRDDRRRRACARPADGCGSPSPTTRRCCTARPCSSRPASWTPTGGPPRRWTAAPESARRRERSGGSMPLTMTELSQYPLRPRRPPPVGRRARPRGSRLAAPRAGPVHRARRRHRGRVPAAAPRACRPRRRLDRGQRRAGAGLADRAGPPRRDRRLAGARRH